MTLPAIDRPVRGVRGPDYKVGPYCSNPGCHRWAEHAHHVVRRSALGGAFSWIELEDSVIVGNLVGLCPPCHNDISGDVGGHRAAIRIDEDGVFWWCALVGDSSDGAAPSYRPLAPLEPQPPAPQDLALQADQGKEESICPLCGHQTRPRPVPARPTPSGGRRRRSWTVTVPDDELENGYEVIDTLVHELGTLLHAGTDKGARYYTLVPALAYCLQDGQRFIDATLGMGG